MLVLLGVVVVVAGFVARINPLLVILLAAMTTGVLAAVGPGVGPAELGAAALDTIARFGKAFNDNRYFHITWLVLPVIGLLERTGLQERARILITQVKAATTGRLLLVYLMVRQATSALGLISLGGHPQMVRPLIAPMAESAAETEHGPLTDKARFRIRSMAAATENGAIVFPPVPAFYDRPATIEDMVDHTVGRVLDLFDLDAGLVRRWSGRPESAVTADAEAVTCP